MHRPLLLIAGAIAFALLTMADVGHAVGTPGQVCAGAKLKATGKAAGARVACHAKAAQKGGAPDPACLAKSDATLAAAFAKAEAGGGCVTPGDGGAIDALLDSSVSAFVAALRPVTMANRCAGAKLKATGKKAKTKLGCQAKATGRGLAVDPACLAKAEARFVAAFAKADARPPCLTTGDAAAVESLVDDLVDDVVSRLPTTLVPVCGNGVREGSPDGQFPIAGEQCDGDDVHPLCASSGRHGCVPPGDPNQCRCCATGEAFIDTSGIVLNECCPGFEGPFPDAPGLFTCLATPQCGASPFPECGGSCPTTGPFTQCAPVQLGEGGPVQCACAPPGPCDGTCSGSACPAGEVCNATTCVCVVP